MNKRIGFYVGVACMLFGIILLWIGLVRSIVVVVDGIQVELETRALTVGGVLREAGLDLMDTDRVIPSRSTLTLATHLIRIERSRQIRVVVEPGGTLIVLETPDRIPGNVLLQAGLLLFPGDSIWVNGQMVEAGEILIPAAEITLQFRQAVPVTLTEGGFTHTFYSSAWTLGGALDEQGYQLNISDALTPPSQTSLTAPLNASLQRGNLYQIQVGTTQMEVLSSQTTVAEVLAGAGLALQGADYSIPNGNEPPPEDGSIQLVRVHEVLDLEQIPIPYGSDFIPDPNTEIDQRSVVTAGQYGIRVARDRVRYESGVEVARIQDSEWVAAEPVDEQLGYGTQIVVRTLDTPNGPIEYWRVLPMWATAYSPCGAYPREPCAYGTSSGMPVQQGTIAVRYSWYLLMVGQQLYVPGYGVGTIGDVCGGCVGKYWVDLGFTDEDLVGWANWTTVYFLTPIPDNPIYILP